MRRLRFGRTWREGRWLAGLTRWLRLRRLLLAERSRLVRAQGFNRGGTRRRRRCVERTAAPDVLRRSQRFLERVARVSDALTVDDVSIERVDRDAHPLAKKVRRFDPVDLAIEPWARHLGKAAVRQHPHDALRRNRRLARESAEPLR